MVDAIYAFSGDPITYSHIWKIDNSDDVPHSDKSIESVFDAVVLKSGL